MEHTSTTKRAVPRHGITRLALVTSVLLIASLAPGFQGDARALDRDAVLEFLPPSGSLVDGYRIYVMDDASGVVDALDIGFVPPDADGVARSVLVLDAASSYRLNMTAYNAAGESEPSNQIVIPAEACEPSLCDDANPCTAPAFACPTEASATTATWTRWTISAWPVCAKASCSPARATSIATTETSATASRAASRVAPVSAEYRSTVAQPRNADGTPCDDGRADTLGDRCLSGVCQSGDAAGFAVHSVAPDAVSPGRHTIEIRGTGFEVGMVLDFENGKGQRPRVASLELVDATTLEARIDVSRKGPKRDRLWDVVLTGPDGVRASLSRALRVTP
jgi:hypothetical protein